MSTHQTSILLGSYGSLLLLSGIVTISIIGLSAKIAFLICVILGSIAIGISYFMYKEQTWAFWAGLILSALLFLASGYFAISEFFHLLNYIQHASTHFSDPIFVRNEGLYCFIPCLIFVNSFFVMTLQLMLAPRNMEVLARP